MIRFKIADGDSIAYSEWQEEPVTHGVGVTPTAVAEMVKLRQQHPDAAISVERTTVIPEPDRKQVRFRIADQNGETRYSTQFPAGEQDKRLAEMREKFPKAAITAEVIHG